jgi:hypothetical protein
MSDPIQNKLSAYLDGELDPTSRREVEAHLETCQSCQAEMDELKELSFLLHSEPQPDFTPAQAFRSQVMLLLPQQEETQTRPSHPYLPWIVLGLVLVSWIFVQASFRLTALVSIGEQFGLLQDSGPWISSTPHQSEWVAVLQNFLGPASDSSLQSSFNLIDQASFFLHNLIVPFFWQIGLAIIYGLTLGMIWHNRMKSSSSSLNSSGSMPSPL